MSTKNYWVPLLIAFSFSGHASADTWREVRTDHFRMISNMNETVTSKTARALVLFDAAVGNMLQTTTVAPSAPITIYLVDAFTWHKLIADRTIIGFANPNDHANYIWVNGHTWPNPQQTVFHELGHVWLASNRARTTIPTWHGEGFAELVSTIMISGSKVWIGDPPRGHWTMLKQTQWIPLRTMLESDMPAENSPPIFYPLAWIVEHYRTFSKTPHADRLTEYLTLLNQGLSRVEALERSFPDGFEELEKDLKQYSRRVSFDATAAGIPDAYRSYEPRIDKISATRAAEVIGEWASMPANSTDAQLQFLEEHNKREPSRLLGLQTTLMKLWRRETSGQQALAKCEQPFLNAQEAITCGYMAIGLDNGTAHKIFTRAVALEPDNLTALLVAGATANLVTNDLRATVAGLERAYARNKYNMAVTAQLAMLLSISDEDRAREYLRQAILNGTPPTDAQALQKLIDRGGLPGHWDLGSRGE